MLWQNIPVSSANILNNPSLQEFAKSFMYIMNNNGPNTDPWGTPHVTGFISEFALFTLTYCCLLDR